MTGDFAPQEDGSTETQAGRTRNRRQGLIVLAAALLVAALALVYLAFFRSQDSASQASLDAASGLFPVTSLHAVDNASTQPDAGSLAPDFAIHLTDGTTTYLSDYRGRPVLINFWATWCGPCRLEMPDLDAAFEEYGDDLVVLGVNAGEAHELVAAFQQELGLTLPLVIDPRREVMAAYKTQSLPSSFFIDRKGKVQVRWIGLLTPELLRENLQRIL